MTSACLRPVAEVLEDRILHSADMLPVSLLTTLGNTMLQQVDLTSQASAQLGAAETQLQVMLVDARVVGGLSATVTTGCEVVVVGAQDDGLAAVHAVMGRHPGMAALHLVTYGDPEAPQLGTTTLDHATLMTHAAEVAQWGDALAAGGKLLLHSGTGDSGGGAAPPNNLQADLAALTGRAVEMAAAAVTPEAASSLSVTDPAVLAKQRDGLGLNFETNLGQAAAGIDFIARGSGYKLTLQDGNATILLNDGAGASAALHMVLQDAAANVAGVAEGDIISRTNYLVGEASQWLQNVPSHASVLYGGVYDGIDVRYYGNQRQLEYDFVVAPGADVRQIALRFDGAHGVEIDAQGALLLTVADAAGAPHTVRFEAPVSYQWGPDGRESVASRYVLASDGTVHFALGTFDTTRVLVIDPTLSYGTYFGNASAQDIRGVAVGGDGSVYLAGSDAGDAVVVKYTANLGAVVYTTYVGGLGVDAANGIAVDAAGSAYVAGTTNSALFAGNVVVTGSDAFAVKLSADGSTVVYANTVTAGFNDEGNGIAVDSAGQAYLVSSLGTGAATDINVSRFNAVGTATYSFTVAGDGTDTGRAIAVNASGQAVITGHTQSTNLGAYLVNAFDTTLSNGYDAYVFQLNAAGTGVSYGTLFGGNQTDTGRAIAYGPGGKIYITGDTDSSNLSTSANAFQTSDSGNLDGFVAGFDPSLVGAATRTYSTYLNGNGVDIGRGIAVDALGLVYVAGSTDSTNLKVTTGAAQPGNGGSIDGFLAVLNPGGAGAGDLRYRTYLGGANNDTAYALALGSNKVVLGGTSTSISGVAQPGGADTVYGGSGDGFAVSFTLENTLIVDTVADTVDGSDTSSITALLANKGSDGKISLREAIIATNNTTNTAGGPDRINFSMGTGGVQTINVTSGALPDITDAVVIDGTTQVGFVGAPLIVLNGSGAGGGSSGLSLTAGNSTVRGLAINSFGNLGISLTGGGNNLIAGNYIGVAANGTTAAGNNKDGIYIESGGNTIGGTTASDRNVISANGWSGIELWRNTSVGNIIRGNYIGLDATGTAAMGNNDNGIVSGNNATGTIIGGTAAGAGNVIAGHNLTAISDGIRIAGSSGGTIAGNRIGTDATGTLALPNLRNGINLSGTSGYTIGGTTAGAANLIANSGAAGFVLTGTGSGNAVLGNSVFANGGLGIDLGAVGVAANDGLQTAGSPNLLTDSPVFSTASLAGSTLTLAGYVGSSAGQSLFAGARVEVFVAAADPSTFGEGKTYLGFLTTDASGNFSGSLTVAGVSVGNLITGTATDPANNTSEFGANRLVSANGAPVNTLPAAPSILEDIRTAITGVSVTDPDNGLGTPTYELASVQLSVSNGVLDVTLAGAASISAGANTSTTLTLSGSQADINATLATLGYRGGANYSGGDTLVVVSRDGLSLTDSDTLALTVSPINDPPSGTSASITVAQDGTRALTRGDFGFVDTPGEGNNFQSVLVQLPTAGTLKLAGTTIAVATEVPVAQLDAGNLVFTPATGASGAAYATIGFQVRDDGGTANGGVNLDPTLRTLTVNVTAAPGVAGQLWFSTAGSVVSAGTPAIGWSAGQIVQYGNAGDTFDINAGTTSGSISILAGFTAPSAIRGMHYVQSTLTLGTTGTQFTLNPGDLVMVLDPGGSPATVTLNTGDGNPANDIVAERRDIVVYRPAVAGNYATGTYFMLLDNGIHDGAPTVGSPPYNVHALSIVETATTVGGTPLAAGTIVLSHSTKTIHNNIYTTTVIGTGVGAATQTTDTQLLIKGTALGLDPVASNGNDPYQIQGLHLLTQATAFNGITLPAGTLLVAVNGIDTYAGVAEDTFDVVALTVTRTEQNGGTLATGQLLFDGSDLGLDVVSDPAANNLNSLTVVSSSATNTPPTITSPGTASVSEGVTLVQTLTATDPEAQLVTFSVAGGPDLTRFTIDVSNRLLFVSAPNFEAPADANSDNIYLVQIRATDSAGASVLQSLSITVTNVNEAPTGANASVSTVQSTPYTFVVGDFGFSDTADNPANALAGVRIASLPGVGQLTNNAVAVTAGQTISAADITAGKLVFTPVTGQSGAGYASFGFQVQDNGGVANGGIDLDPTVRTLTINVSAAIVPPPPVIPPVVIVPPVEVVPPTPVTPPVPVVPPVPPVAAVPVPPAAPVVPIEPTVPTTTPAPAARAPVATAVEVDTGIVAVAAAPIATNVSILVAPPAAPTPDAKPATEKAPSIQAAARVLEVTAGAESVAVPILAAAPLFPAFGSLAESTVASVIQATPDAIRLGSRADAVLANLALATLNQLTQLTPVSTEKLMELMRGNEMNRRFDELQRRGLDQDKERQATIGTSLAMTTGLSVGYVVWLVRGGVLMSSMLSALPAWQLIDPLPVASVSRGGKGRGDPLPDQEGDGEVERLFGDGTTKSKAARPSPPQAPSQGSPDAMRHDARGGSP